MYIDHTLMALIGMYLDHRLWTLVVADYLKSLMQTDHPWRLLFIMEGRGYYPLQVTILFTFLETDHNFANSLKYTI